MQLSVSIIIPVYNEEKYISECINSLIDQTYPITEICVGDDSSSDSTTQIIKKFQHENSFIHIKHYSRKGPGHIRNDLASTAKGEILIFIDGDMVLEKQCVEDLIAPIIQGSSIGTFTKNEYVRNDHNHWALCWNYEYTHEKTLCRLPSHHPDTSPVYRSIIASEFRRVGGYEEIGYGEDWSLSKRLGRPATLASKAYMYHYNPDTAQSVFSQAMWLATRPYKWGSFGRLIGLVRASLPVSFLWGIAGAIYYQTAFYFLFKLVYDAGISVGIIKFWLTKKYAL